MNIKEIAKQITLLESKKETIEKLMKDHNHHYNNATSFTCILDSNQFSDTRKYFQETIVVDDLLFNEYLQKEMDKINKDVKELIDKMIEL